MKKMTVMTGLLLILGFTLSLLAVDPVFAGNGVGQQWLATGIVTRIAGDTMYLLGKDDVIYRIDVGSARVLFNDKPGELKNIQVGDKVRVFGKKTGSKDVRAVQLNVLGTAPRVEEAPPPAVQPEPQAPVEPQPVPPVQPEQAVPAPSGTGAGPLAEPSYIGRGLVKDLHLTEGWITMLTSEGPLVVDISGARVSTKGVSATKADISSGDAIYIIGDHVATGKVSARNIDILSKKSNAESTIPVRPVSEVGSIVSIDYTARTFVMDTAHKVSIFVMLDDSTTLLGAGGKPLAFTGLKPGTRVKVSGTGSIGTGFMANQIIVIGAPR